MTTFVDSTLAGAVRGPVLWPDDDRFAGEIAGFNTAVAHRPDVVVGATSAADVTAAVTWASARGLAVSAEATGHGRRVAIDGGLLITTRRMASVRIDPARRRAVIGAGTTWRQVVSAAAEHGLAPLNGSSSGVGAVGYLLGGGLPVLARSYGFAADHVHRIEIVTADGLLRTVDAEHEPELFWALRGAGKVGFGVVTSIEVGLVPVRTLYGGGIFYPASATSDVLHTFRSWAPALSEQTTASVALLRLPDLPQVPDPLRGRFVTHLRVAHLGRREDGERMLAPMRSAAPALIDAVAEMPYTEVDRIHGDPTDPMPTHDAGTLLRDLPPEAVDALLAAAGPQLDLPLGMVELRLLGGALAQPATPPNAVSGREGAYSLFVIAPLMPGLEQVSPAVVAGVLDAMAPFAASGTALVNFQGAATAGRFGAWSAQDRMWLERLRETYDPAGMFTTTATP